MLYRIRFVVRIAFFGTFFLTAGCGVSAQQSSHENFETPARALSLTSRSWAKLDSCPAEIDALRQNKEYEGEGGVTFNRLPLRTEQQGNFLIAAPGAAEWAIKGHFNLLISPINAKLSLAGNVFKFTNGSCFLMNAGTPYEIPAAVYEVAEHPDMYLMIQFKSQEEMPPHIVPIDVFFGGERAKFLAFSGR